MIKIFSFIIGTLLAFVFAACVIVAQINKISYEPGQNLPLEFSMFGVDNSTNILVIDVNYNVFLNGKLVATKIKETK